MALELVAWMADLSADRLAGMLVDRTAEWKVVRMAAGLDVLKAVHSA